VATPHTESPGEHDLGPALPDLVRGGVESPIEAALSVDGAHDGSQPDVLEPERAFAVRAFINDVVEAG
jgi:hypothetical protein